MPARHSGLRRLRARVLVFVVPILALSSCSAVMDFLGFSDDSSSSPLPEGLATTDWSQSAYDEIAIVSGTQTVTIPSSAAGRAVFYVVTNSSSTDRSVAFPYASPQASVSANTVSAGISVESIADRPRAIRGYPGTFEAPPLVPRTTGDVVAQGTVSAQALPTWTVGDTETLSTDDGDVTATLRQKRVQDEWTLYVWVDQTEGTVTDTMTGTIADTFLNTGSNTDIFDLATGVFGAPWGPHGFSNVIDQGRRDVHILAYDIDGDGVPTSGSRVVGYFWPKDNYLTSEIANSNERLMFYLDAALLADTENADGTDDGQWSVHDFWPEETVSTLSHEFQHMVQFYQRNVVYGSAAEYDQWLNELMSMAAEEVVSRAIAVDGPRGVDPSRGDAGPPANYGGRMPAYNVAGADTILAYWPGNSDPDVLDHYATSYSFGAFLIRTFGTEFFTRLMQDTNPSTSGVYSVLAVESAAGSVAGRSMGFGELMRRWGVAVLVSNDTRVPSGYRLNTGTWIGDGTVTGSVGSLNAHNYRATVSINGTPTAVDGPLIYRSDTGAVPVVGYTNLFLAGGSVPSQGASLPFSLPDGVSVSVILR